jgi:protein involved in polysaccharide export with SLBB domain
MSVLHSGRSIGDSSSISPFIRTTKRAFTAILLFATLPLLLVVALSAQTQDNPAGASTNSWDCSDPLLATSSQCASSGEDQNLMLSSPTGVGSPNQPQIQTRNYSDIESQTRTPTPRNQPQSRQFPPELLTEFQKFTATTTGQVLPIFGANLFQNVPSTFAPLDMAPVPADYVLGPGDELRIRVWGQVNFQTNVRVDRAGEVYMPVGQIGPVHVAGMPYSALNARLREAIGHVYRNFDLQADMGQIRAIQVYVTGNARRPGVYTISSLSSLIDALFASGGPSVQGSLRQIQVRRGDVLLKTLDLYAFVARGDKSGDVRLLSGDVIYIPPVGPQAAVTGSVRVPAIYELLPNEHLADLLADAGGASAVAAEAQVSIERIEDHSERLAMEVKYDQAGLATPVADGDLVRVFSIVPKYKQTVTLRGNIANPGRFAWHTGMRVSDLIPDKDSLITRNYWWKRTQLGLPAPDFEPMPGFDRLHQPSGNHPVNLPRPRPDTNSPGTASPYAPQPGQYGQVQDQYGQVQDQYGQPQDQYGQVQNQYNPALDQNGVPQNPAVNYPANSQQGALVPAQASLSAQQRGASTSLAAQQDSEASSHFSRNAPRTTIAQVAPEIDWDYAVIERLDPNSLKTLLVPFDLGKLVRDHDPSQNLELQPGDVVSILSDADIRVPIAHQTKLVRLEGEVVHAGPYTVQPGETLRSLVERAGGLTPNAYLFGSEFTRQSARAMQQARIDEYVQNLDMSIQRSNLALTASPVSSAQDIASGSSAQASERDLIAVLRQIRATGRIVLQFRPDSKGADTLPDIALEDGDRFVIPHVPAAVNVVGAVNDQNSFLYAQSRRVGSYLHMAGGPTTNADRKQSFVIRADGEVVSYASRKSLWGDQFNDLPVYPGDTIVVPEKTFKPSALRGFLDWSQVFSQLAFGAAAISVLR